jgi:hypothetical protein
LAYAQAALLASYLLNAGCSDDAARSDESGVAGAAAGSGSAMSGSGGNGSSTSGGKLSFATDVYELVIRKRCSACHTDAVSFGSLQLFPGGAAAAYANLVGMPAGPAEGNLCRDSGLVRVQPGDPDKSLIYLKLTKPSCGSQMPPAAFAQPTPEQVELVRKWIADGAAP